MKLARTALRATLIVMLFGGVFYVSWSLAPVLEKAVPNEVRAAAKEGATEAVSDGALVSVLTDSLSLVIDSTAVAASERNYALLDTIRVQGTSQEQRWATVLRAGQEREEMIIMRLDKILCTINPCDPACPYRARRCPR